MFSSHRREGCRGRKKVSPHALAKRESACDTHSHTHTLDSRRTQRNAHSARGSSRSEGRQQAGQGRRIARTRRGVRRSVDVYSASTRLHASTRRAHVASLARIHTRSVRARQRDSRLSLVPHRLHRHALVHSPTHAHTRTACVHCIYPTTSRPLIGPPRPGRAGPPHALLTRARTGTAGHVTTLLCVPETCTYRLAVGTEYTQDEHVCTRPGSSGGHVTGHLDVPVRA
jgi:hypothetical protein